MLIKFKRRAKKDQFDKRSESLDAASLTHGIFPRPFGGTIKEDYAFFF